MDMIGKEILNYIILSLIGKGGMGSVYLAEHKYIKQQKVAIKVINANMVNDFTRKRLAEEADRLSRLNHPNIVRFVNYHIDEVGNVYLIMEYADGDSLEHYIKHVSGLIVEEKLAPLFEPLLDAFEYAHKHNVIHKDIKPSNIIITTEGIPKVLDFGISALIEEKSVDGSAEGSQQDNDIIMGTPSYMSPEQIKGQKLDARSDIYSLGVMLHQMLTGNPPYDTTTLTEFEIYKQVIEEPLPRMKTYYKYISDKMQLIVDKATAKDPAKRFASCADFKKTLHKVLFPSKISLGVKIGAAAAVVVLLAGLFFVWDYNRTKISYYKDYAEQWGVPQGIGKVSGSTRSHLHRMYRFEYKHYKLQRMSHVNSIGTLISDSETERVGRPIDATYSYNSDGKLNRVKVMDHTGNVLYIMSYNEKLNTIIFQYNDEYGTEKCIGSETVGHVDALNSNENRGRISRYLIEYDAKGYVSTLRYAAFQNILVGDAQGIYGRHFVRDKKGRVIEENYLGPDGQPKATKWGLGRKLFTYDTDDNWTCATYQTVDGQPSLDAENGTAICENHYDKYGNCIHQYFKSADGQRMIPGIYGVAGQSNEYDENGYIRRCSYIGIDGKPAFSADQGFASYTTTCNEYGFFNEMRYFDLEGHPCTNRSGYAIRRIVTDAQGNLLEDWYYNIQDSLVLNSDGYAGVKSEYDGKGHATRITFYGTDQKPCLRPQGVAGWNREYNAMGDVIRESYFDTDFKPVSDEDGAAILVIDRDLRGNITRISNFDAEGNPVLDNEGIASCIYKYDENGNEILRQFYDVDDQLTTGYGKYAIFEQSYDERGYLCKTRYFDVNHRLVIVDDNAGSNYARDDRGNITENVPVGTDEKLARNKLISRYKYDEHDNEIEFALYDGSGRPAVNSLGYHKYLAQYNNRNQCTELSYYDTKGQLTNYSNNGFCIKRMEYDARGNRIRTAYFDKSGSPALYTGDNEGSYSSTASEYDNQGRVVREFYFDKEGNPTKPSVMVPEGIVKYDQWGNICYIASADGKGNLIHNPKTGYSYAVKEFNSSSKLISEAYFNEKQQPMLCRDGYHKKVCTYTKSGQEESEAYFGTDGQPLTVNGFHKIHCSYNASDELTEYMFLDKNDKLTNSAAGFARIVITYKESGTPSTRKYYSASGSVVLQENYVAGEWTQVEDWRGNFNNEFANQLPIDLEENMDNLVVRSARIVSSSRANVTFVCPRSKYDMSKSQISTYQNYVTQLLDFIRTECKLPRSVTLHGILMDSKGREIYTVNR